MADISCTALLGKLNNLAYKGIDSATVFCKMRGNPYVELLHWLHQLLQFMDSGLHRIIKHFVLKPSHLARDFTNALDRLPAGSTSKPDFSAHVEQTVERGWLCDSLMYGCNQLGTGHLIFGIVKTSDLSNILNSISSEFKKTNTNTLGHSQHPLILLVFLSVFFVAETVRSLLELSFRVSKTNKNPASNAH